MLHNGHRPHTDGPLKVMLLGEVRLHIVVRWADASYTFMYLHVDVYFLVYWGVSLVRYASQWS